MRFDDSFDVTKCLQKVEIPDLCAPISGLPSTISTMVGIGVGFLTLIPASYPPPLLLRTTMVLILDGSLEHGAHI